MKFWIAALMMIALSGFASFGAKEPSSRPHVTKGRLVKLTADEVSFKGGLKGKGKSYDLKIDDKTKILLDGKEAKAADLTADVYIEVTQEAGVATCIKAFTTPPTPKKKGGDSSDKSPTTQPADAK